MPSITKLAMLGGAGVGAYMAGVSGWRHSADDPNAPTINDRFAYTGSSVVAGLAAGGVGGLALSSSGFRSGMLGLGRKGIGAIGSVPLTKASRASIGPTSRGAMMGLLIAGGVAAGAYIARSIHRDGSVEAEGDEQQGSSVRERMGLMGASGETVFGLNNVRHG